MIYKVGELNKNERNKLFKKIKNEADVILFLFEKDAKSKENLFTLIKNIFENDLEPYREYKKEQQILFGRQTLFSLFKEKFDLCDFQCETEGLIFYNDNKYFYNIRKKYLKLNNYKQYTSGITKYISNLPKEYWNIYVLMIHKNELTYFNVIRNEEDGEIDKIIYGCTLINGCLNKVKTKKLKL